MSSNRQQEITKALDVVPPFADEAALVAEVERRKAFIKDCLRNSGLKVLVLGISGGVDSTTAGRLAQLSVEELRAETGDDGYRFIAVRLPYNVQHDEADAQVAMNFIRADEEETVNIADSVIGLAEQVTHLHHLNDARRDFVTGNIKARIRMVAQFAIANANNGLVIGTDHAAEAVMGFFTKFGDGACDLAPLSGLVKNQARHRPLPGCTGQRSAQGADSRPGRTAPRQAGRRSTRRDLCRDRRLPPRPGSQPACLRHHRSHLRQHPAQAQSAAGALIG